MQCGSFFREGFFKDKKERDVVMSMSDKWISVDENDLSDRVYRGVL